MEVLERPGKILGKPEKYLKTNFERIWRNCGEIILKLFYMQIIEKLGNFF